MSNDVEEDTNRFPSNMSRHDCFAFGKSVRRRGDDCDEEVCVMAVWRVGWTWDLASPSLSVTSAKSALLRRPPHLFSGVIKNVYLATSATSDCHTS